MTATLAALPALSPEEREHVDRVEAAIRDCIAERGGWIDFETFMALALYAPGLGYYSAGSTKLGPAGDFVTAPEISDLFSRSVARQCAEILAGLGGGEILEIGPGSGRMAAAVLEELAALGALPERYALLEVSADLKARQRACIARLPSTLTERVVWIDRWPRQPIRGVVLANEVLDALACRRFVVRGAPAGELGVGVGPDGALIEVERPAGADLAAAVAALRSALPEALAEGYRSELCLRVAPWIRALSEVLEHGAALLFDYGLPRAEYYHPDRVTGTLRCHFKHRAHADPLIHAGVQDITAWVDFTRVAEAADAVGLEVLGFATQAAFLLGAGIQMLSDALASASVSALERARLAGEARQLLLPGEMGEAFKVMVLGRDCPVPLCGLAHQDLRGSL